MCLAIPAIIVELLDEERAVVDLNGLRKEVSLALVEDVAIGDYVIIHVGFALQKMDVAAAERTLELLRELGAAARADAAGAAPPP